jgi:hypothetical protein
VSLEDAEKQRHRQPQFKNFGHQFRTSRWVFTIVQPLNSLGTNAPPPAKIYRMVQQLLMLESFQLAKSIILTTGCRG